MPNVGKGLFNNMQTANVGISLRTCDAQLAPSLSAYKIEGYYTINNEGLDQTAHD